MDYKRGIAFLSAIGTVVTDDTVAWLRASCPLAPWRHKKGTDLKPSFGLKLGHKPRVYCFSCGFKGDPGDLVLELQMRLRRQTHDLNLGEAMRLVQADIADTPLSLEGEHVPTDKFKPVVFSEEWLDSFPPVRFNELAVNYLLKRDIPYKVWRKLDLRWHPDEQRVCFPIRDWSGHLRGLHGRSIYDVDPRYRMLTWHGHLNPNVWLGEDWVSLDKTVVFAESVFDLVRVYQIYRNVMSPLTASVGRKKAHRVSPVLDVITLFDNDEAGTMARAKISKELKDSAIQHLIPPAGAKDAGDMTVAEMSDFLSPYVELDESIT